MRQKKNQRVNEFQEQKEGRKKKLTDGIPYTLAMN